MHKFALKVASAMLVSALLAVVGIVVHQCVVAGSYTNGKRCSKQSVCSKA